MHNCSHPDVLFLSSVTFISFQIAWDFPIAVILRFIILIGSNREMFILLSCLLVTANWTPGVVSVGPNGTPSVVSDDTSAQDQDLETWNPPPDLVIPKKGILLRRVGTVAENTDDQYISLLIKIPKWDGLLQSGAYTWQQGTHKDCTPKTTLFSGPLFAQLVALDAHLNKIYEDFISSRRLLLKPFIRSERQRRSIIQWGLTLLSPIISGIEEVQLMKIRKHVRDNEQQIKDTRAGLHATEAATIAVKDKVIGLIKNVTYELDREIQHIQCDTYKILYSLMWKSQLQAYSKALDQILKTALEGTNIEALTPEMIGPMDLARIVNSSDQFRQTLYQDDPNLLYSLGRISLIEIDSDFNVAHFILKFPRLVSTFYLYKVDNVGLHLGNNQCAHVNVNNYVYWDHVRSSFTDVILTPECQRHFSLYVCDTEHFTNHNSCLQRETFNCTLRKADCETDYRYVQTSNGVLIRNNLHQSTFLKMHGMTKLVTLPSTGTTFVNWSGVDELQVGKTKIMSPQVEHRPMDLLSFDLEFNKIHISLDPSNVSKSLAEICDSYNSSLHGIFQPMIDHYQSQLGHNSHSVWFWVKSILIYSSAGVLAIGGIAFTIYLLYRYYLVRAAAQAVAVDETELQDLKASAPPTEEYEKLPIDTSATL